MRYAIAVLLALVAGCPGTPAVERAADPVRPRLVVLLVIDQLPTWAFERDRALFTGGFARLLREGGYVAAGELPHANTFTAPGHATIGTGAPPSVNGIVGNGWYRRDEQRDRPAEYDPAAPVFSVMNPGETIDQYASSKALRVDGLADQLRRDSRGRAHSVAIALKARAATLVTGRKPDVALWFEEAAGGMTTSKAYAETPPPWVVELARKRPASSFVGKQWTLSDPDLVARHTNIPDIGPGEDDVHGLGVGFPHPITELDAIQLTPFGDEIVLDAVHAAIDELDLGEDDVADLLAISLNSHDYAGHTWGPDSWEVLDLTLRLDRALGVLFERLDRKVGKDGWAIVMTSDHGATPLVERGVVDGARRVSMKEVAVAIESSLATQGGPWVAKIVASQVYMTAAFNALEPVLRGKYLMIAERAAREMGGIESVHITEALSGDCTRYHGLGQVICRAIVPGASGELYLVPARGSTITDYTSGTHHDGPNPDNRHVPILVRAPGVRQQAGTGSMLQVAPTVAALLGISPPPAATAKPLFGISAR